MENNKPQTTPRVPFIRVGYDAPESMITDPCDRCGGTLALGYEHRYYLTDVETGASEDEFVCNHCMGKDADAVESEG
jgi:hypothetical protein